MTRFVLRRISDADYRLERPDGTVLVEADASNVEALPSDADAQPRVPADLAEPVVSWAESNDALHEWRVMQWLGVRYVDER